MRSIVAWLAFTSVAAAQGPPLTVLEEAELVPLQGKPEDAFGSAVAIDGDVAVIGAPWTDSYGIDSGAAYVFEREGLAWTQTAKLVGSGVSIYSQSGWSVAVEGNTAVVGTAEGYFKPGSTYVFIRGPAGWVEAAHLQASDGTPDDYFGHSVALSGDTLLVGAFGAGIFESGAAYVFDRVGSAWTESAKLLPSASSDFWFGRVVALHGDRALIGAPAHGGVYVFVRSGSTWTEEARLGDMDAWFLGGFVTLHDRTAVVAEPGAAKVYVRESTGWCVQALLPPGVPAIDGDAVVLGVHEAARTFQRTEAQWSETPMLTGGDPGDNFGWSVALSGNTYVVGAPQDYASSHFPGSAYVFRVFPAPIAYCTAKASPVGCLPTIHSTGVPSASANSGFTVVATDVRNQRPGTLLHTLAGRNVVPFQGGVLCLAVPIHRTPVQGSGGHLPIVWDCSGGYRIDMNAFAAGSIGGKPRPELALPGTFVHCQWWGRDPADPAGTSLSDALQYVVGP